MVVGEIFLAGFIKVVLGNLLNFASDELLKFARREKIHTLLTKWSRTLEEIEAVLADAEEKQISNQRGIKVWLEDLEELAYDLDDILDEFATEALRCKLMAEEPRASTSKVRALIPACCTSFNPSTLMSDSRMRSKIEDITARLQDIFERRRGLGLQMVPAGTFTKAWQRPNTTSLIQEPCVYGRDEDKKQIIELLLSDEMSGVGVIPIVGMGGVGKTTLAQMVYNDEMVEKHFDVKAWVCASEEFDIMGVTKAILESVTRSTCDFNALDLVQVQLKQALAEKKFLIVLDDVWNNNYSDWSSLKSPFNDGAQGSKVMVTTRNTNVALMMGTAKYHCLKQLSEVDCWSVFAQHAFENVSTNASPNLVSIGRKIVGKCGGLPLAAKTLGGLLRCKLSDGEWEDVLNSNIWELSDKESYILPALRLSYHHLPLHLKRCFAYCSILPKAYEFHEAELVLLWMAEGFIQQPRGNRQMEDLGCDYFRELLSRSFFQPSSSGDSSLFVMHDLINDLAQFFAREISFRLEDKLKDHERYKNISKARHSSYTRGHYDGIKRFEAFKEAKRLQTFLPCGSRSTLSYLTNNVPLVLLPNLRRLRVLSLRNYRIAELPSSIGNLKHVRYLDLSFALFSILPESLSTLYNLQTLLLTHCKHLKKLPSNTGNLINLRHLSVAGANSLQEMPPRIDKLTSLQTLSNFIVSEGKGFRIKELGNLIHLRATLRISGLENVVDALDARGASLHDKQGLHALSMEWGNNSDNSRNERVELKVLDMLKPHKMLKVLTISCYHGPKFPTWVGDPLFSKMVLITLENCKKCTRLPPLGQLSSLARLYIRGMAAVQKVGLEFYGTSCSNPFPSLKTLHFQEMPEWKYWSPFRVDGKVQAFAQLSELSFQSCPKLLGKLPNNLPCLKKLEIKQCPQLVVKRPPSPTTLNQMRNTLRFKSLTSLHLHDVSILGPFLNEVVMVNAACDHLRSLNSMTLVNIQNLTCLPRWFYQGLTGLQELKIYGCNELTALWQKEVRLQQSLLGLRRLEIRSCPKLVSLLGEEEDEEEEEEEDEGLSCIMWLKYLLISDCEKLVKLPRGLHTLTFLRELRIKACPSLVSLPEKGLPSRLITLEIRRCDALQSLSEVTMHDNLQRLVVEYCKSLTCLFSKGGLPKLQKLMVVGCVQLESIKINCPSLECIKIQNCENLKCLLDVMRNNNDLRNLMQLQIIGCDNLEYLPEGWLTLPNNLRDLVIRKCKKLEALLPHRTYNNNNLNLKLTSIQFLVLARWPAGGGIDSYFLKEGIGSGSGSSPLANLTSLNICNIEIGMPPSEWGLHRLSSLRKLWLGDYRWVSLPEDGMVFPTSLIFLSIWNFPNLEKLSSKGFQNLTSLEELLMEDCPRLASFPKEGLPPSIASLLIRKCPNLASFPEKGLPPSLLYLGIRACPILKHRCEKQKGRYWPFISHIPRVKIDMTEDR